MANFALTAYILREHRDDYNVWKHLVLPGIGTLALLPVLWTTVYPYPSWPINLTPYIFIAALLVGRRLHDLAGTPQRRAHCSAGRPSWSAGPPISKATWTGTPAPGAGARLAGATGAAS